jgi:hypothetical protein
MGPTLIGAAIAHMSLSASIVTAAVIASLYPTGPTLAPLKYPVDTASSPDAYRHYALPIIGLLVLAHRL